LVSVSRLLKSASVKWVGSLLATYTCPRNKDIEDFVKTKAIDFALQGIAQTHLVLASASGKPELVGYFALANKVAEIPLSVLSKSYQRKVGKFGVLTPEQTYVIPMPLIAQLGKNYNESLTEHITGAELLRIACEKVMSIQAELGGRCVYLECEDTPFLTGFYCDNGFRRFSPDGLEPGQLVRMIKYQ
jgi:hypothetical protein